MQGDSNSTATPDYLNLNEIGRSYFEGASHFKKKDFRLSKI